ncbi:biotin lipoate protein ligase-like protein, putative [Bodo saltans]|uniref:Biotin lipoate protein ligase-like protein, putative n=1 Tax=Bodo saltans TaxID=75058 RepID=A0A0S4JE29_BODSA|nr:biotin lipoate protein ligase-like protein, putative [Bodo saltans]|eukprot:CUG89827.1 biotin lipoate protein ligase-like protein, putative [Bodo saltans]
MRRGVPSIRYLDTVTSTMDVAKEMIAASTSSATTSSSPLQSFGVVAKVQTHGRGTSEKFWASPSGNLMFTIGVPMERIATEILPVLPLVVGIAVREAAQKCSGLGASTTGNAELIGDGGSAGGEHASATSNIPVKRNAVIMAKWPNDTVWDGRKLSGSLIEHADTHMLIGIGVNVDTAPEVADGGRPTVCLREIMREGGSSRMVGPSIPELAETVWTELFQILERAETKEIGRGHVVQRFSAIMNWGLTLNKRNVERTAVRAVRLNSWGHLVVIPATTDDCEPNNNHNQEGQSSNKGNQNEEVLMSEYLF